MLSRSSGERRARPQRANGPVLPGLLITALVLGGIIALSPAENMRTIRRLAGFDDDRLATAPAVVPGEGSYEFSLTQRDSQEPVGYDPCRPIEVVVNPDQAPDDYDELVDTAIERTSAATGLRFDRVGLTDSRDFDLDTVGVSRQPVLVGWATSEEVPELAGDTAGIGGSIATGLGGGRLRYVTGVVVLDSAVFEDVDDSTWQHAQAIVDHEFGHLVGLGHVDDPDELMNEQNLGVTTFGPGDLEGLARLGNIDC